MQKTHPLLALQNPQKFAPLGGKQANPSGLLRQSQRLMRSNQHHVRPFIEDVDDRLRDLDSGARFWTYPGFVEC